MGKHISRQRKPSQEKVHIPHKSPKLGIYWIFDIASKAVYYPINMEAFKRTYTRLIGESRELKTSHKISA